MAAHLKGFYDNGGVLYALKFEISFDQEMKRITAATVFILHEGVEKPMDLKLQSVSNCGTQSPVYVLCFLMKEKEVTPDLPNIVSIWEQDINLRSFGECVFHIAFNKKSYTFSGKLKSLKKKSLEEKVSTLEYPLVFKDFTHQEDSEGEDMPDLSDNEAGIAFRQFVSDNNAAWDLIFSPKKQFALIQTHSLDEEIDGFSLLTLSESGDKKVNRFEIYQVEKDVEKTDCFIWRDDSDYCYRFSRPEITKNKAEIVSFSCESGYTKYFLEILPEW